jgi:hypothetical protein
MNVTDRNFGEGNMNFKRVWVLLLAVAFGLTITVSLASADYVVIKDKNGRCSVRESDHKTPKTIAGPFKTKEEAYKAKEKECATAQTPKKEKEPGFLDKIKEKAGDKEKAKQEAKEKAEKAKQELKNKQEKAKQEAKEKAEKAKQALKEKQEKAKKEKEEKSKPKTSQ